MVIASLRRRAVRIAASFNKLAKSAPVNPGVRRAIAFANNVLPIPGGPTNSTPFGKADQALYKAKVQGRDRVVGNLVEV